MMVPPRFAFGSIPRPAWLCLFLAFLLASPLELLADEPSPAFQAGDRWIAVGDSITQGGLYSRYIELFHVLRTPGDTLTLYNAGINGDSAEDCLRRFAWDISPRRATVATVMLGMNDCGRDLYAPGAEENDARRKDRALRIENYGKNLAALVDELQASGTRVVLVTPSPFDDTSTAESANLPGANGALALCAETVRKLAADRGLAVIDLHQRMTDLNAQLQTASPQASVIGPDRVHPQAPGHFVMAYEFLRAQHPAAPLVQVHVSAQPARVIASHGARVEALAFDTSKALRFELTSDVLPFPVPKDAATALTWVPFVEEFNREELRVTGLSAGSYRLAIDDVEVGSFEADELERGINLALFDTPQRRQAETVRSLLERRWAAMAKLRRIAEVEHAHAGSLEHPLTLEAIEPILAKWEARLLEKPSWQSKQPGEYREWKPVESQIAAEAERWLAEARAAAQPVMRRVSIQPALANSTP